MPKKLTTEIFKERSSKTHNNKYDYTLVEYSTLQDLISIICPLHGLFTQRAKNHLDGKGCKTCGDITRVECRTFNVNDIIKSCTDTHGDTYNYDHMSYSDYNTKIDIECKLHGTFKQTPRVHISGKGCPHCGKYRGDASGRDTLNVFISKSIEVHGNRYDYQTAYYVNTRTKLDIICLKHGTFEQTPNSHLAGAGCPRCKGSHGEREVRMCLDSHGIEYTEQYKFKDCVLKSHLPFDFYIPHINTVIEYHGIQHYEYIEFFHKNHNGFLYQLERDRIKRTYCSNNNIDYVAIRYNCDNLRTIIETLLDL
jgi:protein-arginine kinase activator protein McsA